MQYEFSILISNFLSTVAEQTAAQESLLDSSASLAVEELQCPDRFPSPLQDHQGVESLRSRAEFSQSGGGESQEGLVFPWVQSLVSCVLHVEG